MTDVSVKITGLRETVAAFKQVDAGLPKEMRLEFLGVARHVVGVVQQRMPHRTGTAQSSVVPRASQKGAGIAIGGARAEYAPWLDFGGAVGRKKSVIRPFIREGRYLYPAIVESNDEIQAAADAAVKHVAEQAGFETKGGL